MIFFLLWYTFDDWLAAALGVPWLGSVPIVLAFCAEYAAYVALAILGRLIALPFSAGRNGQ